MKLQLNASEIANLWTTYMNNLVYIFSIPYYMKQCEDEEIRSIIELALEISQEIVVKVEEILKQENFPLPFGFTEEEVDLNAPRLYSDQFALIQYNALAENGLGFYSLSLVNSTRLDVRDFFTHCVSLTTKLYNQSKDLLVKRGLANSAPTIPIPEKTDFVHNQGFLTGWFGDRRPLNAIEINQLVFNIRGEAFAGAKLMSYSQIAKSKELREFFVRGKEMYDKHIEVFTSLLRENDLPSPTTYESEVTTSTKPPFSDKMMMFFIMALGSVFMGRYGTAMGLCNRRDIGLHFSRLLAETAKYLEDAANIMIKNGWMEQPPQATVRKALAEKK
ncbi:hypothetical protein QFZ28_003263 [Neobacillus niacini]|uniref:DUF3231 family protein n=1 Tax=Neobacillus niacini TaxID=86668 RepID=UPI002783BB44|nr:DUF3231 family protein [Neobacillus niacini]MDQ1002863.1 hypothetical protein [Neobacillus niacini]